MIEKKKKKTKSIYINCSKQKVLETK